MAEKRMENLTLNENSDGEECSFTRLEQRSTESTFKATEEKTSYTRTWEELSTASDDSDDDDGDSSPDAATLRNNPDVVGQVSEHDADSIEVSDQESDECLPSAVTDVAYIYMPPSFRNFEEREEWKKSGKWLLYSHGNMDRLDLMWQRLTPLVGNRTLVGLKSSTATDTVNGVIMCYTSDYEDRDEVKRAADAIRDAICVETIIYYKTNEASESGLYIMHGDVNICKYMHTVACSLYEKDRNNRWMKIALQPEPPVDLFI